MRPGRDHAHAESLDMVWSDRNHIWMIRVRLALRENVFDHVEVTFKHSLPKRSESTLDVQHVTNTCENEMTERKLQRQGNEG